MRHALILHLSILHVFAPLNLLHLVTSIESSKALCWLGCTMFLQTEVSPHPLTPASNPLPSPTPCLYPISPDVCAGRPYQ